MTNQFLSISRKSIFLSIIFSLFVTNVRSESTQNQKTLEHIENYVANEIGGKVDRRMIRELSTFLYCLGPNTRVGWSSEIEKAQADSLAAVILPIIYDHPDHAKILKEEILEGKSQVLEENKPWTTYSWNSGNCFVLLENMQTYESVSTLAEFLDDTKGGSWEDRYPTQVASSLRSNARLAARSLYRIGLKERPVTIVGDEDPEDWPGYPQEIFVDPWKKWWQEIVDGKRTFSFIGDSRQFNAQGLVTPRPRISRPDYPSNGAGDRAIASSSEKGFVWVWILLGVFSVGSVALFAKRIWCKV